MEILFSQQIQMPYFVSIIRSFLVFNLGDYLFIIEANVLKNSCLLHLRIVFDIKNTLVCFFHLALLFLVSRFVIKRYDDMHLIIPHPIKHYFY